jgi:nicotinic acid mononucleotide adenylyltransferase
MSSVVFAFGRFQPPTIAHGMMFQLIKNYAASENADYAIFVSKTHDKKKNPLTIDVKIGFLREMFPGINFIECNDTVRTPVEAAKFLNEKYKNLVFVAGGDRIDTLGSVIEKQNGIDYIYDSIELLSIGERDPDSDGIEGVSGTAARKAALDDNFAAFRKMIPNTMDDNRVKFLMEMISTNIPL